MRFAFFEDPCRVAMLFALGPSLSMRMLILCVANASLKKLQKRNASVAALPVAYSSDSADDSATVAYVLPPKRMLACRKWIENRVVRCVSPDASWRLCKLRWPRAYLLSLIAGRSECFHVAARLRYLMRCFSFLSSCIVPRCSARASSFVAKLMSGRVKESH